MDSTLALEQPIGNIELTFRVSHLYRVQRAFRAQVCHLLFVCDGGIADKSQTEAIEFAASEMAFAVVGAVISELDHGSVCPIALRKLLCYCDIFLIS